MGPIVIIVDALDESGDAASRRVLLRILGNAMTESRITDLPANLRILLTFRPLPDIHAALSGRTHIRQKSMATILSESTKHDILRYVSDELSEIDLERPSQEVFASLLAHRIKYSSGHDWPVHISGEKILGQCWNHRSVSTPS